MNEKKTKIAFYSEKKGVGKSTLSLLIAAHIKDEFQKDIALIDVSNDKFLYDKRQKEINKFSRLESFSSYEKDLISIYLINNFNEWKEKEKQLNHEVIFFDIDGYKEDKINYLLDVDYIFIISNSKVKSQEFNLDIELLKIFKKIQISSIPLKEVFLIVNQNNEKEFLIKGVLSPFVPNSNKFKNLTTLQKKSAGEIAAISEQIFNIFK